jgi:rhodanese-related sulfurtransferase
MTDRTPAVDANADEAWTPFGGDGVHPERTPDADARPSTVRVDEPRWRPLVIEGGRGHADAAERMPRRASDDEAAVDVPNDADADADGFDAAVEDALAAAVVDTPPAEPETAPAEVEPEDAAPEAAPAPPAAPAPEQPDVVPPRAPQTAPAPAQEADSTPHTPHPAPAPAETPAPAQEPAAAAETPHSTPWVRNAVGWLNLYNILDQPLPPVRQIYQSAWDSVATRSGLDKATEIVFVCGVGVPLSIAARIVDAAGHSKWRLLGLSTTAALWTAAVLTAPVDASTIAWWTVFGYWASTIIVIPAVLKATE